MLPPPRAKLNQLDAAIMCVRTRVMVCAYVCVWVLMIQWWQRRWAGHLHVRTCTLGRVLRLVVAAVCV